MIKFTNLNKFYLLKLIFELIYHIYDLIFYSILLISFFIHLKFILKTFKYLAFALGT